VFVVVPARRPSSAGPQRRPVRGHASPRRGHGERLVVVVGAAGRRRRAVGRHRGLRERDAADGEPPAEAPPEPGAQLRRRAHVHRRRGRGAAAGRRRPVAPGGRPRRRRPGGAHGHAQAKAATRANPPEPHEVPTTPPPPPPPTLGRHSREKHTREDPAAKSGEFNFR